MSKPTLYIFTISHYCEKARWALDALSVDYVAKPIAPGLHRKKAQKLGLKQSSVPYLSDGNEAISGSSQIIDWAENRTDKSLTPDDGKAVRDIVTRLDDVTGVHIRRQLYSEAIPHHPETVRPIFETGLGFIPKMIIRSKWDMVCDLMIKGMDLGDAQGLESQKIVEAELDWLDDQLSDGRQYLVGDSFSRADITAASLLAPIVNPPKHPAYGLVQIPPKTAKVAEGWMTRPALQYVSRMYEQHR